MDIPRSDENLVGFFKSIIPDDPSVTMRPMFGNLSAFVNGNMFIGVYGEDLFVRLSDDDQKELLKNKGASNFAPMAGRPMKEYVTLPQEWTKESEKAKHWVDRSLEWTAKMPPKKKDTKMTKKG